MSEPIPEDKIKLARQIHEQNPQLGWRQLGDAVGIKESTIRHIFHRRWGITLRSKRGRYKRPDELPPDSAVVAFYFNDADKNKYATAKHFGISEWTVNKALVIAGHPEEATASAVAKYSGGKPEAIDINGIKMRWPEYLRSLRNLGASGNLDAFVRSACDPIAIEGNTIVLQFRYPFHKEKIEDPKYQSIMEKQLEVFFGQPYHIRCILAESNHTTLLQLMREHLNYLASLETRVALLEQKLKEKGESNQRLSQIAVQLQDALSQRD